MTYSPPRLSGGGRYLKELLMSRQFADRLKRAGVWISVASYLLFSATTLLCRDLPGDFTSFCHGCLGLLWPGMFVVGLEASIGPYAETSVIYAYSFGLIVVIIFCLFIREKGAYDGLTGWLIVVFPMVAWYVPLLFIQVIISILIISEVLPFQMPVTG